MTLVGRSLAASMGLPPFLCGIWMILFVFLEEVGGPFEEYSLEICNWVCTAIAIVVWVLIWRRRVIWTRRARIGTILSSSLLLFVAVLVPLCCAFLSGYSWEGRSVGISSVMLGLWLMFTAFFWWPARTTSAEERIQAGIRCLRCGYSLRGLTATRCPECGFEPTMEVLCAAWVTEQGP